ncbi:hypothetical protein [Polaribacter ponticola]|uniref:Type I restriction modification DNA specificity domain-containing protein n=1 Tax=Polaribacter ponticola TaxID=2978475 RepID=A0ABT5S921_9FLAO|nr:hypothetical protein [Polaribacter sp. MSW5]MDD7913787.1 hypothetical protein [Polaribacter sp. MSW5]
MSTFLLSKYGRFQTLRESTGNVQLNLFIYKIKELVVPELSSLFQSKIDALCSLSYEKRIQSKQTYKQAENLLLKELGLENFKPTKEAINIKSFSESFGATGRIDSEYFQPKYEIIEKAIKSYKNGYETFDYFIENYSTGFPYKSNSYIKSNGVPLIRINNIKKGYLQLDNAIEIPRNDLELSVKDIANENDLLISMSGTIGNSCKIPKGIKAVINQRIMRITPKTLIPKFYQW